MGGPQKAYPTSFVRLLRCLASDVRWLRAQGRECLLKAYYNASVSSFLKDEDERILGVLTTEHHHALEEDQRRAWLEQLSILKAALACRADRRALPADLHSEMVSV